MSFKLVSVGELRRHGIGFHVPPDQQQHSTANVVDTKDPTGGDKAQEERVEATSPAGSAQARTRTDLPFVLHEYDDEHDDEHEHTANDSIPSMATLNYFHSAPADDGTDATAGFAGSDMDRQCVDTHKWRKTCFLQEEHGVYTMLSAPIT